MQAAERLDGTQDDRQLVKRAHISPLKLRLSFMHGISSPPERGVFSGTWRSMYCASNLILKAEPVINLSLYISKGKLQASD